MTIIGFCNPLLDITLNNHPNISLLLQKYQLKDNDIILAGSAGEHDQLVQEIIEFGVEYSAGGAGMNSLRCAQTILPKSTCRIVGSIGKDDYGRILNEKAQESGLATSFQMTSDKPSGKCACLIHQEHRSLVAYLGAANDFSPKHLKTVRREIEVADLLYITGFFYSVSPESVKEILNYKRKGRLIFNLSATFVPEMLTEEDFHQIMQSAFMMIGNLNEFEHLKRKFTLNSLQELAQAHPNVLIIETDGGNPIKLFSGSKMDSIPIAQIKSEEIVDTNGAGDAFAGGILAGLHEGKSLNESIELGSFMASCVIKKSGTNPPTPKEVQNFNSNK